MKGKANKNKEMANKKRISILCKQESYAYFYPLLVFNAFSYMTASNFLVQQRKVEGKKNNTRAHQVWTRYCARGGPGYFIGRDSVVLYGLPLFFYCYFSYEVLIISS